MTKFKMTKKEKLKDLLNTELELIRRQAIEICDTINKIEEDIEKRL